MSRSENVYNLNPPIRLSRYKHKHTHEFKANGKLKYSRTSYETTHSHNNKKYVLQVSMDMVLLQDAAFQVDS